MAENTRENKMGTMPIGKLLANMAGPVMISMLFQALYNIVDSVFVARLSQDAMNAVSLASRCKRCASRSPWARASV